MKRILKLFLLMTVLTAMMSTTVFAAETLGAGFYGIGKAANVSIVPCKANGNEVKSTAAVRVGGSGDAVKYYEGAVRLEVTYSGESDIGDQFVVMLVTDKNKLPTAADAICYINQEAGGSGKIEFDVYPMLPNTKTTTDMTLYITSNREDFTTIAITMTYSADNQYKKAAFVKGDVNGDAEINVNDALAVIRHILRSKALTGSALAAADVIADDSVDIKDAMAIINYVAGRITEF